MHRLRLCLHFSMRAGPHPRSLSRGDFAPRSGRRRSRRRRRRRRFDGHGGVRSSGLGAALDLPAIDVDHGGGA